MRPIADHELGGSHVRKILDILVKSVGNKGGLDYGTTAKFCAQAINYYIEIGKISRNVRSICCPYVANELRKTYGGIIDDITEIYVMSRMTLEQGYAPNLVIEFQKILTAATN